MELPPELRSFVSSAEEVFSEIGRCQAHDLCTYRVYMDNDSKNFKIVLDMYAKICDFVKLHMQDYIWYRETFNLHVIFPSFNVDGSTQSHFYGSVRHGDCVDDEWYIVYLLLLLTKEYSQLSCSICDSDGDFLLIESADHIPSWLSPDNSSNRVWLREGSIHIVPLDEPGQSPSGGMHIDAALMCLRTQPSQVTLASKRVQACIRERTVDRFPQYISASRHNAVCTVPRLLAGLFQHSMSKQLLSEVVNALCSPEASSVGTEKDKIKHMSSLSRLGQLLQPDQELVPIEVCFTRSLFARLSFQPFTVPQRLHAYLRRATDEMHTLPQQASSRRLASQSAELGCKIICGLELAYQVSQFSSRDHTQACSSDEKHRALLECVNRYCDTSPSIPLSFIHCSDTSPSLPLSFIHCSDTSPSLPLSFIHCSEDEARATVVSTQSNVHQLIDGILAAGSAGDCIARASSLEGDSVEWLHLTPDELETEMQLKAGMIESASPKKSNPESNGELQHIISGMEKFMSVESDLKGVKSVNASRSSGQRESDSDADGISAEMGLTVNSARLGAILRSLQGSGEAPLGDQGMRDNSLFDDDFSSDSESSSASSGNLSNSNRRDGLLRASSVPGCGKFALRDDRAGLEPDGGSGSSVEDSDDEENDDDDDVHSDGFSDEYDATMEEELLMSTMRDSFLRSDVDGQVDVEQNLLRHLLESHASQHGSAGPASALLSQLGIKLPDPPKV